MRIRFIAAALAFAAAAIAADLGGMFAGGLQHPAIQYFSRPASDRVAELNRKIQAGEVRLKFEKPNGYLQSLLAALDVPVESQLVVFSKTSLLARLITPQHPRTVFFNDSVVITWIPGEPFVEIAAEDPRQGIIFYAIDEKPAEKPVISRRSTNCLVCHNSLSSLGVPGMLVRSVLTNDDGTPLNPLGESFPDHRSPFTERWGGWYVTGTSVPQGHRGNTRVTIDKRSHSAVMTGTPALRTLDGVLDSHDYPTPYSDVIAMLVFEHQMHAMNLLTRAGWESRAALHDSKPLPAETLTQLADYLLFVDEWPISGRIEGSSGFAEKFSAQGPRDPQGRSLRQFDLEHRMMRYPCSYMIYSPAFDGLPAPALDAVYRRMWDIVSRPGKVTRDDRRAVVEILRTTKAGLPPYFDPAKVN
jgi:hypothetical protein